jgi:hypothetical protein
MTRNLTNAGFAALCAITLLLTAGTGALAQKVRTNTAALPAAQQPLFSEYKGIRLGMTADEVRAETRHTDAESRRSGLLQVFGHRVGAVCLRQDAEGGHDFDRLHGPRSARLSQCRWATDRSARGWFDSQAGALSGPGLLGLVFPDGRNTADRDDYDSEDLSKPRGGASASIRCRWLRLRPLPQRNRTEK